jgi:hypothetical protein
MAVIRTSEVRPDVQYSALEFFFGFRKLYTTFVGKWICHIHRSEMAWLPYFMELTGETLYVRI